jgi:hypothetical protein
LERCKGGLSTPRGAGAESGGLTEPPRSLVILVRTGASQGHDDLWRPRGEYAAITFDRILNRCIDSWLDGPHERVYAILKAFDTTYIVRHIHTNMSEKRFPIPPES